ncbi:heptosyltransferase I [Mesocricetibacter intestinalis]|uniref:Heptosyltransferase I n=1 Tax=Mesocricetibacter intestinalis TaxID=1521930 RepID=A0A4R6V744_9PAST|nr:glycosyltransferase family 9 protein [Mesocricetibacter intestinalis]TDQ56836.1 heptosyltransferase I [Mesocricetibacter intestinalis]
MSLFSRAPSALCILRLSAIGDVCHALAAVQQIQQHWPETRIVWVVGKTELQLLSSVPGVEFIPYDKKLGWKGMLALWRKLRDYRFDALLNMQTALRASLLSMGIRADYKIGFGKRRAREGQQWFVNRRIEDPAAPHVLDGFLAFAAYLGVPTGKPQWRLGLKQEDYQGVRHYIDSERKTLIISPCSSKAEKDWLPERYAEVADFAYEQGMKVILCASPAARELKMVAEIERLCRFRPLSLAGKTSLKQLAALIDMADLVIAPDSGPAHIATVQGTPVIGLYAYHNPLRTGPYNNLDDVISVYESNVMREFGKTSAQLPWATKLKGKNLMAQIQAAEVMQRISEVMQREAS